MLTALLQLTPVPIQFLAVAGLPLNWFDAVFLASVIYGGYRGKANGLSGEHVPLGQWILIGLAGGTMGDLLGSFLMLILKLSSYWSHMIGTTIWIVVIWGMFAFLKGKGHAQLRDSDWFGKTETPLGIAAGALKSFCILLTVLSLLNGRIYTVEQIRAQRESQIKELGSALFPTVGMINGAVFQTSFVGPYLRAWFGWAMITASPAPARR